LYLYKCFQLDERRLTLCSSCLHVHTNHRIDAEELKTLLRRHNNAFTEDEIIQIGEMFYAGKAGGSVSFERFIEAIDRVVQREELGDDDFVGATNKSSEGKNPLGVGSCGNEYLFYKSHGNYSKEDLDIKLTHTEPQNMRDRLALNATKGVRYCFDIATGWNGEITTHKVLNRTIFLETIAAGTS
jgi:Alternative oxidase